MAARQMELCMVDNEGRQVATCLPHMQSCGMLREMIAKGIRTEECWAEMKTKRKRVHAAMRAIHGPDWRPTHDMDL